MILNKKNIVITGGGRGIGRIIALRLASEGANIILISRTESELKETISFLSTNELHCYFSADISNKESILRVFENIIDKYQHIDVLINCAGIQKPIGTFIENDLDEWVDNFRINFFGTVYCTKAVLPGMVRLKKGKIINFSGGGATGPRENFSAYGVSKTAIVRFTETVAAETRSFNIDINAVAPGAINTNMLEEVIAAGNLSGKEYDDAMKRKGKGGDDPDKAADLISFLCSEESNKISGKLIAAQWDPYRTAEFIFSLINENDSATLRRIDNKTFYKK